MSHLLRALVAAGALALAAPTLTACPAPSQQVAEQVVPVGCGTCVFGKTDGAGCFWAAEIDGTSYWVQGVEPQEPLLAHGPEGMCTLERKARVAGRIAHDRFVATEFELLPVDGTERRPGGHEHAH